MWWARQSLESATPEEKSRKLGFMDADGIAAARAFWQECHSRNFALPPPALCEVAFLAGVAWERIRQRP